MGGYCESTIESHAAKDSECKNLLFNFRSNCVVRINVYKLPEEFSPFDLMVEVWSCSQGRMEEQTEQQERNDHFKD